MSDICKKEKNHKHEMFLSFLWDNIGNRDTIACSLDGYQIDITFHCGSKRTIFMYHKHVDK